MVVKKGRIDHEASGHDDMVIAWLLSEWFLTHTTHLDFYGIDTTKILKGKTNVETDTNLSPVDLDLAARQELLRQELEETYEKLKAADNDLLVAKLEHKLKVLNSRITEIEDDSFSIDALIRNAKEARDRKSRLSVSRLQRLDPSAIWNNRRH